MKLNQIELNYMGISFTMGDLQKYMKDIKDCQISKIGGLMYFRNKLDDYKDVDFNHFDAMVENIINLDSIKSIAILFALKKLKNNIPVEFLELIATEDEDLAFDLFRKIAYK